MRKYLILPFDMHIGSVSFGEVDVLLDYGHENIADHKVYSEVRERHGIRGEYPTQGAAGIVVDAHQGNGTLWFLATGKYLGVHTYRGHLFAIRADGRSHTSSLIFGAAPLVMKYCTEEMAVCASMTQKRMDDYLSLSAPSSEDTYDTYE